jgi:RNA recognition motif-containing protein
MKLYVGNLSFDTTENDLQDLFAPFGDVREVALIQDKFTNRSRGFGFVTMGDSQAGEAAIAALHEKSVGGRNLTVNEARAREERPARSFGGDRGGRR